MFLSIIIPVYNEEKTVQKVLKKLQSVDKLNFKYEIIIIDDASIDNTLEKIRKFVGRKKKYQILTSKNNAGKGAAIRKGFSRAKGKYILIQDADLEYHPKDIPSLIDRVKTEKNIVVYGTRLNRMPDFQKDERSLAFFVHYLGNKFLSLITSVLYGQWITDMETGYKLFPKSALRKFKLFAGGFDIEPELTAKLLKNNYVIVEISISTNPRSSRQGKKLVAYKEGPKALWTLIKYRFTD